MQYLNVIVLLYSTVRTTKCKVANVVYWYGLVSSYFCCRYMCCMSADYWTEWTAAVGRTQCFIDQQTGADAHSCDDL